MTQHEIILDQPRQKVKSLHYRDVEAVKAIAKVGKQFETVSYRFTVLVQNVTIGRRVV